MSEVPLYGLRPKHEIGHQSDLHVCVTFLWEMVYGSGLELGLGKGQASHARAGRHRVLLGRKVLFAAQAVGGSATAVGLRLGFRVFASHLQC